MRNKIFDIVFNTILMSIPLALLTWSLMVIHQFHLGSPYYKDLFKALKLAFYSPNLVWITYGSLFVSVVICAVGNYFYYHYWNQDSSSHDKESKDFIRGSQIVKPRKLKTMTLDRSKRQVTLAGVPIPFEGETLHFLIVGRTGTGKTVAIKEMLSAIIPRMDRVIITDPNGDFISHFWKKGDVILNPFDKRGEGWSIFNEIRDEYDFDKFAKSVIPPAKSAQDAEWHRYAQLLFSETAKRLMKTRLGSNYQVSDKELTDWLTIKPVEELKDFLNGTAAAGLFDPGASKALASTRFIIANYVAPYQYLREGDFSLRTWLHSQRPGNLFITWREDMAEALRPLISTWLDILCTSALSLPIVSKLPKEKQQRIWLIIDELASLERLNSLEAALTRGRQHGLRIVTGLQSTAQLEHLYGRDKSVALRSCFSNLLLLGGTSSDAQTAKDFSEGLGDQYFQRVQVSKTRTRNGINKTEVNQRLKEAIVLPSEIVNLPKLTGFLSLAGEYPLAKIKLKPLDLPVRHQPFVE